MDFLPKKGFSQGKDLDTGILSVCIQEAKHLGKLPTMSPSVNLYIKTANKPNDDAMQPDFTTSTKKFAINVR